MAGLQVLPCAAVSLSLRPAGGAGAGGAVSKWEVKRALKLALGSLPAAPSIAHEECSLASSGAGLVRWRIAAAEAGEGAGARGGADAGRSEAESVAGVLRGKILRVAAKGAAASVALSDVRVSTAETAVTDEAAGQTSSTVKIERVPAAWVAVSSDGLAEEGTPAHDFAARFGDVRVCECTLRQSADVLLPLEVDICVRYSDEEEARRAVQLLNHCVVKKEGSSMVYGPSARFVDDRLLSDEALAERAKQREAEQKRATKLRRERERCEEELEEDAAALHRWMEETAAARDALAEQPVVHEFDEAVKKFLHRSSQLQQALQTDVNRDKLKAIRHQLTDAMRNVEHRMHRLLDAYQQRQAELELQERVMMTAKMRDTGRRLLADVDEYTECRRRVFAGIQEGVVTEGAGAAVLEAVRQAEALIRSYTSLSQICRSLMEKETVFTDKYMQGLSDYLGRCMEAYRQAKPRIDLVESLAESHRRHGAMVAAELAARSAKQSPAHTLLRQCLDLFRECCHAAAEICQSEATSEGNSLEAIRLQSELVAEALGFALAMRHAVEQHPALERLSASVRQRLLASPRREIAESPLQESGDGMLRLASGAQITPLQYLAKQSVQVVASGIQVPRRLAGGFGVEAASVCKTRLDELEAAAEAMSRKMSSLSSVAAINATGADKMRFDLCSLREAAEQLGATIERACRAAEANVMQLEDELSAYRHQIEAHAHIAEAQHMSREQREMGVEDRRATTLRRIEQLQEKKRNLERQAELERKRLRPETKEFEHEGILLLRPAWELAEPTLECEQRPSSSSKDEQERPPEGNPAAAEREAQLREKLLAQALRKKFAASRA